MKTFRILAALVMAVVCVGLSSCSKDYLDKSPKDECDEETLYPGYIDSNDYECLGAMPSNEGKFLISGLKDKHLWFGVFEYGGSKTKLYEWIDPDATNKKQNHYIGYGDYKEFTLSNIYLAELKEIGNSGFIGRALLLFTAENDNRKKLMTVFRSSNQVNKRYSDWITPEKYNPIMEWYESSWIIDNCCYSSKGDTIFIPKIIPSANDNPVSYREGIYIDGQTITRINYEDNKIIWQSEVTPPFQVSSSCRYAFTLQDSSTSNWRYKVDVTYYDGTKKDFTFTINIENGETLVEGIKVTGITLNNNMLELDIIDTFQFLANIQPADATNKNITWKSSNEEVATIYKDGLVAAKSPGETTITVTTEEGNFTASSIITVKMKQDISAYIVADLRINGLNSMGQFWGVIDSKISNNSDKAITLTKVEIINGDRTIIFTKHFDDKTLSPRGSYEESIQGLPAISNPISVKWAYLYNNQKYSLIKTFNK